MHQPTLEYSGIHYHSTGYEPLGWKRKWQSTYPLHLFCSNQYHHAEASLQAKQFPGILISKRHFCLWEHLGVSGSYQTRISGCSNPRVHRIDAVAFRSTCEHLRAPATNLCGHRTSLDNQGSTWEHGQQAWVDRRAPATRLGASTKCLGAPGSADEMHECAHHMPGRTEDNPGTTKVKPGSIWNHCSAVREKHFLWECCWCAWTS